MPHKVNPIHFENAEAESRPEQRPAASPGDHVAHVRLQRDLTDSSTLRNIGSAFGYAVVAFHACYHGLTQVAVDPVRLSPLILPPAGSIGESYADRHAETRLCAALRTAQGFDAWARYRAAGSCTRSSGLWISRKATRLLLLTPATVYRAGEASLSGTWGYNRLRNIRQVQAYVGPSTRRGSGVRPSKLKTIVNPCYRLSEIPRKRQDI